MGFRAKALGLFLFATLGFAACLLNPHPIPPSDIDDGGASADGWLGTKGDVDQGGSDSASPVPDAGNELDSGKDASDAGVDASDGGTDASAVDSGDASSDAPDDVSE